MMRTTRRTTARIAALLMVSTAALSACGGDDGVATGSVTEFCTDFERADEVLSDFTPEDADGFRRLREAIAEITYPGEISDDANTLVSGLDAIAERLDDEGGSFEDLSPKEIEELGDDMTEFAEASTRIADFSGENCESDGDESDFDYVCADIEEDGPCGPDGEPLDE